MRWIMKHISHITKWERLAPAANLAKMYTFILEKIIFKKELNQEILIVEWACTNKSLAWKSLNKMYRKYRLQYLGYCGMGVSLDNFPTDRVLFSVFIHIPGMWEYNSSQGSLCRWLFGQPTISLFIYGLSFSEIFTELKYNSPERKTHLTI